MVVYWEYAFLENALLDGLLLYLALRCARGTVRVGNLGLAAASGGAEAVVFPLLALPAWAAYAVKVLGGAALCLIAGSGKRTKTYVAVTAFFFLFTFTLGGLLTAAYSFFGVEKTESGGYLIGRAPAVLVVAVFVVFAVIAEACVRAFYRYRKVHRALFDCVLTANGRCVRWKGFADSGNCLMFRGAPVCVISAAAALALFGRGADAHAVGRMRIATVNGSSSAPVLRCDSLRVGEQVFRGVFLTIGEVGKEYSVILHTAFTEGEYERVVCTEKVAAKPRQKPKRRTLSVRK